MITIFNREKIYKTYSMKDQAAVRNLLDSHGIRHSVRVVNRRSASPFGNGTRAITGSFGEDAALAYEYTIYVHKKDFALADRWLRLEKEKTIR